MKFHEQYRQILIEALNGVEDRNARTGTTIKVVPGGLAFKLDLNDGILPTCGLRLTRPYISAAEVAWCILGHDHINWLRKHTTVWDEFAALPLDGHRKLKEAYGNRWRHTFGRDQLQLAIQTLHNDPTDRRVWISSWDPSCDGLGATGQKTVPCPVGFTLSILNNRLQSSLMIRSSDLYMGLPYDVMRHALLMQVIAQTLQVALGFMQVTLAHPHLYEKQWDIARQMTLLDHYAVAPPMPMPSWSIQAVENIPDDYVELIIARTMLYDWPVFNPKSEVVK